MTKEELCQIFSYNIKKYRQGRFTQEALAEEAGLSPQQINGIEGGDYIYPGEELLIPNSNTSFYLTKDGDTISDVFNYFNISNDNYSFINDVLLVGDQLIVYKRD